MKFFLVSACFLFFSACGQKNNVNEKVNLKPRSSVEKTKDHLQTTRENIRSTDTTVSFSIDGLSSEGSEANVHYVNGRVSTVEWSIFGETGQLFIEYKFLTNGTVKVKGKKYQYKTDLSSVRSDSDMKLISSFYCVLDTNGTLRSKPNGKGFVDVFSDFKKAVPFELKHLR